MRDPRIRLLVVILCLALGLWVAGSPQVSRAAAIPDLRTLVVGIGENGRTRGGGVVLSSGTWGTDYLTVSHALYVGGRYEVTFDGKTFDESRPVAACSSYAHGIDVLILRVAAHQNKTVVIWGDSNTLQAGDELTIVPRSEIHPNLEQARFLHVNFLQWLRAAIKQRPDLWAGWEDRPLETFSREYHNTLVAEGFSKSGMSGSPWVKDGKVFGLNKGSWQPQRWTGRAWDNSGPRLVFAESASRISECLRTVHYEDLIPKP